MPVALVLNAGFFLILPCKRIDFFLAAYFTLLFSWLIALLGLDLPIRFPVGCTSLPFFLGNTLAGFAGAFSVILSIY